MTLNMPWSLRPATRRVHEVGAKVLSSIPQGVAAHTLVRLESLPRITASCDAVVRDEGSGDATDSRLMMPSLIACRLQLMSSFCVVQIPFCASLKQSIASLL